MLQNKNVSEIKGGEVSELRICINSQRSYTNELIKTVIKENKHKKEFYSN